MCSKFELSEEQPDCYVRNNNDNAAVLFEGSITHNNSIVPTLLMRTRFFKLTHKAVKQSENIVFHSTKSRDVHKVSCLSIETTCEVESGGDTIHSILFLYRYNCFRYDMPLIMRLIQFPMLII